MNIMRFLWGVYGKTVERKEGFLSNKRIFPEGFPSPWANS